MLDIARINHNEKEGIRVTLSIDNELNLYADGEKIETPKFKNLKEVDEYIGTVWGTSDWDLEWLVEDLPDPKPIRFTLRLHGFVYEKIWQIHAETRKSINQIINEILEKGLENEK